MNSITDRQNKLLLLKKLAESKKFKEIKEELEARREDLGNVVLNAYAFPEDGADLIEEAKYNHKNKAIWGLNELTKFKQALGKGEAEAIIIEDIDKNVEDSETYIKFQVGMDNSFNRPTEKVFTETDKAAYIAQVLKDLSTRVERKIKDLEKKEDSTKAEEDETSIGDDPYEGTEGDVDA